MSASNFLNNDSWSKINFKIVSFSLCIEKFYHISLWRMSYTFLIFHFIHFICERLPKYRSPTRFWRVNIFYFMLLCICKNIMQRLSCHDNVWHLFSSLEVLNILYFVVSSKVFKVHDIVNRQSTCRLAVKFSFAFPSNSLNLW
jgi:hypothetical protein